MKHKIYGISILGYPIKFKYMVLLTNETQTMFYFPRTIKFNTTMFLDFIREPNLLYLSFILLVFILARRQLNKF